MASVKSARRADFSFSPAPPRSSGKVDMEMPGQAGRSLYDPRFEHDACGVGFVARVSGQPDHDLLVKALRAVANLTHRGAVDADQKSGDGAGILTQLPRKLLVREAARLGVRVAD